jgi:hypothetical protein
MTTEEITCCRCGATSPGVPKQAVDIRGAFYLPHGWSILPITQSPLGPSFGIHCTVCARGHGLLAACDALLESYNVGAESFELEQVKKAYEMALDAVKKTRGE